MKAPLLLKQSGPLKSAAVGGCLAVMKIDITTAYLAIGGVTTVVATAGVLLSEHEDRDVGRYAEPMGGVALIVIGFTVLYQHLTA